MPPTLERVPAKIQEKNYQLKLHKMHTKFADEECPKPPIVMRFR
jgi:hypothetical protein